MLDPAIQVLLLIVGTLLTVLSTMAIVMQRTNSRKLEELAVQIAQMSATLNGHMLAVARDYVTHEQLERHCKNQHGRHNEG